MASPNKLLFEKDGVFIHTTVAKADEDALVAGKIFIWERKEGVFIEWKALDELDTQQGETDWTVVDAVGYKPDGKMHDSGSVSLKPRTRTHHKYIIDFDVKDMKSLKRSRPNLGWSYLIFILKDGTTYPALHFHHGGTKAFVKELEKFLLIKKSPSDPCLYLVREQDPQALSKSFDELQLFEEQAGHMLTKFMHDPVTATMGGFSRVTNFLRDTLIVAEPSGRPNDEMAEILSEDLAGMAIDNQEEPGFEMVTTRELPPRPDVVREPPLSPQRWARHMDKDGCITDTEHLKQIIFRGGVEPSLRGEVWKFLLGYYSWDSTHASRAEQRKHKVDDYFRMKLQWKSISPDQEQRFSLIRDRKGLIDKDVLRTDRVHQFYKGDNNPNVSMLYDILMTYCMYNFDLGYVQGMSDLLSPILVVMENEVDAFWCFAGFMDMVCHNFDMDQEGMKRQLHQVNTLVRFTDPQLCNYLESHESSNMYFCFRWLLILFKREFNFPDIMRLWEVWWTGLPCKNFHLIMCLALLDTEKITLMENNFGFTEILKHINDITGTIELESMLKKSEAIFLQLQACGDLPDDIEDILGLASPDTSASTPDDDSHGSGIVKQRSSTPSTPERVLKMSSHQPKPQTVNGLQTQSLHASSSSSCNGMNGTPGGKSSHTPKQLNYSSSQNGTPAMASTPDDSSIEILPDHMDLVY